MAVVLVALCVAGLAMVGVVRTSVLDSARATAQNRARDVVAELVADGRLTSGVNLEPGPDHATIVSVLNGDTLVAASDPTSGAAIVPTGPASRGTRGLAWFVSRPSAAAPVVVDLPVVGVAGVDRVRVQQGYAAGSETVADVQQALVVGIPVLVALVGALTYVLAGRALRPVEAIRRRSAQISEADLAARIDVPATGDEIERLAVTLNEMLDRLHRAYETQSTFVADASHELRTPLAAMRAEIDVATRQGGETDWGAAADRLLGVNLRMQAMVDDMLALARAGEGDVDRGGDVDLDDVVESVGYTARSRSDVAVEVLTTPTRVVGDVAELTRAVQNLVENATRWAQSRVRLSLEHHPGVVVVNVDDDGPGVPRARREEIFERFVRLDEARSREFGGAGLGLAIVRAIAEGHHGSVRCRSSPLGGARLQLTLPASDSPQPSASTR